MDRRSFLAGALSLPTAALGALGLKGLSGPPSASMPVAGLSGASTGTLWEGEVLYAEGACCVLPDPFASYTPPPSTDPHPKWRETTDARNHGVRLSEHAL